MRVIGLFIACLIAFPAFAKDKPKPAPKPEPCKLNYVSELRDARDAAKNKPFGVYPIEGTDVQKFLAIFNAAEPKTDFKAERILVLVSPLAAYVEMFQDGCVNHNGKLGVHDFEALMGAAFGGEIVGGMAM